MGRAILSVPELMEMRSTKGAQIELRDMKGKLGLGVKIGGIGMMHFESVEGEHTSTWWALKHDDGKIELPEALAMGPEKLAEIAALTAESRGLPLPHPCLH